MEKTMEASFSRRQLLTPTELRTLSERSDLRGGLQMASHMGAIFGVGVLHAQAMGTGWVWVTGF
ncbi:MAG: rhizopine catabolism protein, partial [Paracoccaceae bacterium]|nr:rhizopine catabolism protein [Paracoccaceae bacterium]